MWEWPAQSHPWPNSEAGVPTTPRGGLGGGGPRAAAVTPCASPKPPGLVPSCWWQHGSSPTQSSLCQGAKTVEPPASGSRCRQPGAPQQPTAPCHPAPRPTPRQSHGCGSGKAAPVSPMFTSISVARTSLGPRGSQCSAASAPTGMKRGQGKAALPGPLPSLPSRRGRSSLHHPPASPPDSPRRLGSAVSSGPGFCVSSPPALPQRAGPPLPTAM